MRSSVLDTRRYFLAAIAVLCVIVCSTRPSGAVSFERKDLHALTRQAEAIVVGRITGQQSRRLATGLIVTDFTIAVENRIKGPDTGPSEVVTMAGGTIGGESQEVVGFPTPVVGARYLLFIGRQRVAVVPFVGGHQGMYRIERDPDTRQDFVGDAAGRPIRAGADPTAGGEMPAARAKGGGQDLSLDDFVSQIRQDLGPEPSR